MPALGRREVAEGAGGSAGFRFFSIGGGGGGESRQDSDVKKTENLQLSFDNIAEIFVDRGSWYNPALFANKDLADVFEDALDWERLKFVVVSLVVCRGLSLSLTMTEAAKVESWSKKNIQGSGGVSVFGFSFGASGSKAESDWNVTISDDGKTVTFKDGPELARLVAVRLVQSTVKPDEVPAVDTPDVPAMPSFATRAGFEMFAQGEASYARLMARGDVKGGG